MSDTHDTPSGLQRAALHDLAHLASDCRDRQRQADARRTGDLERLVAAKQRLQERLQRQYHDLAARQQHEAAALGQHAAQAAMESAGSVKANHAAQTRQAQARMQASLQHLQRQQQAEILEVDGLFEATVARLRQPLMAAQRLATERREALDGLQAQLAERSQFLAIPMPAAAAPSADPSGGQPFAALFQSATDATDALRKAGAGAWYDAGMDWGAATLFGLGAGLAGFVFLPRHMGFMAKIGLEGTPLRIAVGAACLGLAAGGIALFAAASRRGRRRRGGAALAPAVAALAAARAAAEAELAQTRAAQEADMQAAAAEHARSRAAITEKMRPLLAQAEQQARLATIELEQAARERLHEVELGRHLATEEAKLRAGQAARTAHQGAALARRLERGLQARHDRALAGHAAALAAVRGDFDAGCRRVRRMIDQLAGLRAPEVLDWSSPEWSAWSAPARLPADVRVGTLRLGGQVAGGSEGFRLDLPADLAVPAMAPASGNLLIEHDAQSRAAALQQLRATLARLVLSMPPGMLRLTFCDPVGRGESFASFMHLAESEVDLVGGRIWTDPADLERKLDDLAEHMETVIQKFLRGSFETLADYNAQAGELAEPCRALVVADLPAGLSEQALAKLAAIAASGTRCGVFVLALHDPRHGRLAAPLHDALRRGTHFEAKFDGKQSKLSWKDPHYAQFPFVPAEAPPEPLLARLLDQVAVAAVKAARVEVPFHTITPPQGQMWSRSAAEGLRIPVGRSGVTRVQDFELGRGTRQHALVAGKTGSGKSSFLNAVVTNLAMWYPPDEAQVFLIDFKKGVEFKAYATHRLAHAAAVAIESDLEFGLSVLRRLDAEMERRGELFRQVGAQSLADHRQLAPDAPKLPRVLLIIDEFQEFFAKDDKLAQDAGMLLDRIARQGRAFGVHMLLGSQTLGGSSSIPRSTLGQMAVRVALQCDEADAQMILSDTNTAARLLSRPGEAIYNDAAGKVEANNPFQVAWLPDEVRDECLRQVAVRAAGAPGPLVFEGGAVADPADNPALAEVLAAAPAAVPPAIKLWTGSPVAIKEATHVLLRRHSGDNLAVVGAQDEAATGVLASALLGADAQCPAGSLAITVLDGTPEDAPHHGALARSLARTKATFPAFRETDAAVQALAGEVARRVADGAPPERHLLVIHGLQRFRSLRKSDEGFSFSMDAGDKPPSPDKLLARILKDGPAVGVHVLLWADSAATLERCFERGTLREFDHRLMFQLSANDSSMLMDATDAATLGPNRALLYSEERGSREKCLPYRIPRSDWLATLPNR